MDELQKDVKRVEKTQKEIKKEVEENEHSLARQVTGWLVKIIVFLILGWTASVIAFFVYLGQYDYVSTYEASGFYANVDNQGVMSYDLTPEQFDKFMEWLENDGNS